MKTIHLTGALMLASVAAPSFSQTYYMRAKLPITEVIASDPQEEVEIDPDPDIPTPPVTDPTYTYELTYGAWSACMASKQTAKAVCTRSDDQVVSVSYCGVAATKTQSCTPKTLTCTQYSTSYLYTGSAPTFTTIAKGERLSNAEAAAKDVCQKSGVGFCYLKTTRVGSPGNNIPYEITVKGWPSISNVSPTWSASTADVGLTCK